MSSTHASSRPNRWQGFVLGVAGSIVGLLAMRLYSQHIAPLVKRDEAEKDNSQSAEPPQPLDDIAVLGKQYQKGESSTAALGRIFYTAVTGSEPQTDELKTALSYLIHWYYGLLQGGLYGAWSADRSALSSGLLYATGLWLVGDEIVVPVLGLQSGPTAVSPQTHFNRFGAHLFYGLGTAVTTRLLRLLVG